MNEIYSKPQCLVWYILQAINIPTLKCKATKVALAYVGVLSITWLSIFQKWPYLPIYMAIFGELSRDDINVVWA